jgi:hypothetical protein
MTSIASRIVVAASSSQRHEGLNSRDRKRYVYTKFGGWGYVDPNELERRVSKTIANRETAKPSADFLEDVVEHLQVRELLAAYAKSKRDMSLIDPKVFVRQNREARIAEARAEKEFERRAKEASDKEDNTGIFDKFCSALKGAFYDEDIED